MLDSISARSTAKLGGWVLTIGGLATLPEDVREFWQDFWHAAQANQSSAVVAAIGGLILVFAYREALLAAVGIHSDRLLAGQIERMFLKRNFHVARESHGSEVAFQIVVTDPRKRPFTIARVRSERFVRIQGTIMFTNKDYGNEEQTASFYEDVKIELARKGLEYVLHDLAGGNRTLGFWARIDLDRASDDGYMNGRLTDVLHGMVIVIMLGQRARRRNPTLLATPSAEIVPSTVIAEGPQDTSV